MSLKTRFALIYEALPCVQSPRGPSGQPPLGQGSAGVVVRVENGLHVTVTGDSED